MYRNWGEPLPDWIEPLSFQPPGHGWRIRERPLSDLHAMADVAVAAMLELDHLPMAIFGHSMGAWLGLEVVRRLERAGRNPLWLFASGRQAPALGCTQPPLRHLDDASFVREMKARYGGIPPAVLAEPELMELLLPAMRADVEALETYTGRGASPIQCPITALGGEADGNVPVDHLEPWRTETEAEFELLSFSGSHFYFEADPRPLLETIVSRLEGALALVSSEAGDSA